MGNSHRDDSGNTSARTHATSPDGRATSATDRAPHETRRAGGLPTEPIHLAGVTIPRVDIVHYLRKTNICFRFAFGSPCPHHSAGRCPFVHGIIPEGSFAIADPPPERKSYGISYVRPPCRLIALTDGAQGLLTSWCIPTPGIDQPEIQEGLIDGDRTTHGDIHDEDVRELDPDA